ncbi:MAG: L-lactate permease, partial [Ruminococcaceae bacterium]|nr:L-lactate permease [Oscillospiraceae bacterium]
GLSFVLPELVVSRFLGPELTVIVGCVVSLACTFLMARARKNKPVPPEYDMSAGIAVTAQKQDEPAMPLAVAGLPFILIFVLLLLTSKLVPPVNSFLSIFKSTVKISTAPSAGPVSLSWINTPGIIIFVATVIGSLVQKASGKMMWQALTGTVKQMSKTIITIMSVLAVAKIMTYSGMIADMAHLFVVLTGRYYPFVAPIIAAIGAFVTGSGTNTEVLLGTLQTAAAQQIGVSKYWLAAANSLGAGVGKIMSPQCVATAVAAVGLVGQDSKALRAVLKWALIMLAITCVVVGFGVPLSPA